MDRKRGSHIGRKRDSPHRTSAHTFGNELSGSKSAVDNDFVNSSVERPSNVDRLETERIATPTLTQEFFNSLYKDALNKPPADISIANKMFCPHLSYGFKSPPRVVRKLPREMPAEQSENPVSLKSESRSFFTRVISALDKINNDRNCNSSRASLVRGGPKHDTCVHVSLDREPETKQIDEVVANPMSGTLNTIQVEDPEDTITGQREGVTRTMSSEISGHNKNPEKSMFTIFCKYIFTSNFVVGIPAGQDELMLAAAHISPIFRIYDPSIFELEHLPKLTWSILLGHKSKNT